MSLNKHQYVVSVVMCTFNGENFIKEQLTSIQKQTYPIYEIVVVDDGSTDGTVAILEEISKVESRISFLRNPANLGYNKNFEKALSLATGDVIAIADQDDVWDQHKIERMLDKWVENTPLIYCGSIVFKKELPSNPKPNRFIKPIKGTDPVKLAIRNTVSGHAMIIKKELLQLALPFDPAVYYDWWLAIVATCNGGISHVDDILVFQRGHDNNQTLKKGLSKDERFADYKIMLLNHLKKFQTIPNIDDANKLFFSTLYSLWGQALKNKNRKELFLLLFRYRKRLFDYKIRKVPAISQIKHSYRYAFKAVKT